MEPAFAESAAALAHVVPERVAQRLSAAFGSERVLHTSGHRFRLGAETERVIAFPRHLEELSEMLKLAYAEGWRVVPAGAGTWLEMGNRSAQFNLIVSTQQMNRVLEYEPADLTCTLEAGVPLRVFNERAAEHRQFIPLDPFGAAEGTIGATVATASAGPWRCAYGTPRDWLIGARVAHVDGTLTKAGGKVVKNVAGYDLCKLYTGSFGTLVVLAELSFKLRALPVVEKTLAFYAPEASTLCALAARLFDSDLQPAAMELLSPQAMLPSETGQCALLLRFWNEEAETVEWQIGEAVRLGHETQHTVLTNNDAGKFWRDYHASEIAPEWAFSLRASVLPAELGHLVVAAQRLLPAATLRAHAANGVLRLHGAEDLLGESRYRYKLLTELRETAQARGGQMVILRAPEELKNQLDVWGAAGFNERLMRGIKAQYDPHGRLNTGRFVAGI